MNELVSIVVPVYNCAEYLEQCLCSILNQTYKNIEVLVVNDGSTDNSQEIIDRLARTDSRICKMKQDNKGVSEARNCALKNAKGAYYLFVDGDDYVGADYVKSLVECAVDNQSELVICGYKMVYKKTGRVQAIIPGEYKKEEKEEWAYRISSVCGRLYSSNFWKNNGLMFITEENARAEDVPLDLFANVMARNVCVIKEAEYYYVQHSGSAMNSNKKVPFLFPYNAFEIVYNKVRDNKTTNSKVFFDIGVLKFIALFKYVIYRNASAEEKKKFQNYVYNILKSDLNNMKKEWSELCWSIELPLQHKAAIFFLLRWLRKN